MMCLQVIESLKQGHQAMVFVHSRKDTGKTARMLATKAQLQGDSALFDCQEHPRYGLLQKDVKKSRNRCIPALPADVGLSSYKALRRSACPQLLLSQLASFSGGS